MIHYSSILIPAAVLLPNALLLVFPPTNIPSSHGGWGQVGLVLTGLEWIGRIGLFILPLFSGADLRGVGNRVSLLFMIMALSLYYAGWLRFFMSGRDYALLYEPLWMIPLPLAISPVIYFIFAAKLLDSLPLLVTTLIFGLGHVPISYSEYRNLMSLL